MTGHLLAEIEFTSRGGKINAQALSELLNPKILEDLDPATIILRKLSRPTKESIRIEFLARKIDYRAMVYNVIAFKIYDNLLEKPVLKEYRGKNRVLANRTNNCVKGIHFTVETYTTESCRMRNYSDPRLAVWEEVSEPHELPTQVHFAFPETFIYCYKKNITIETQTFSCPPYPFRMNANIYWNTSDASGREDLDGVIEDWSPLDFQIDPIHLRNISSVVTEMDFIDRYQDLTNQYVRIRDQNRLIGIPALNGEIDYRHTPVFLMGIVFLLICLMILRSRDVGENQQSQHTESAIHPNAHRFLS